MGRQICEDAIVPPSEMAYAQNAEALQIHSEIRFPLAMTADLQDEFLRVTGDRDRTRTRKHASPD